MSERGGQRPEDWSTGQYPQAYQGQGYEQGQNPQHPQNPQDAQQPYGQQPYEQYEQQGQYDQYGQPVYGQGSYGGGYGQQQGQQTGQFPQQYEQQQYPQQYDQYGQPVYGQQQYDQYGQPVQAYQQGGYGYQDQGGAGYGYDGYQQAYQGEPTAPAAPAAAEEPAAVAEPEPVAAPPVVVPRARTPKPAEEAPPSEQVAGARGGKGAKAPKDAYATGEFSFAEEETEESEDVIDWMKFTESRGEVRAERRRKLRNRLIGLAVVVALAAGGTGGYLWLSSDQPTAASAAGGRSVNLVHLRDLQGKVSSALLVNDAGGKKGTVLLLPDTLRLPGPGDPPVTTVGQAMDSIGASGARDGLATVLGAPVAGTWRLDTPYLELLVAQLGGVRVDTNAETKDAAGKQLSPAGKNTLLGGKAAVAYATLQAPGENRDAQLARFGQVLDAVVRTMPTAFADAKDDVHRMNAVLDPSLPEDALAGVLAQLAQQAKDGHLSTATLTVRPDGGLDEATAGKQVKDVLGGTVKSAASGDTPARVSIQDATGNDQAAAAAQVQVTNAGLTFVPGGAKTAPQAASEIRYTDDARQAAAKSLATSLGLPETAAKKTGDAQTADLVVVLGKDYQVPKG
ncbi:LCP family protein [Streptomyces sp. NRRL WC-3742]|uniref:LCP family protein n=1 Tax=Streptomyces sp. NRRL WC-3742 TaxID=1463934 RepID=UPI00068F3929|nr:LCP family protein [Streptomyces sp. NRRL WC-3742]